MKINQQISSKHKMVEYNKQIEEFEKELSTTKYNKKSQKHIGLVKAKIAILKEKQVSRSAGKGKTEGFEVRKTGDGTVIMVGFPSVGKSTLLNAITNADSPVGAYAFTTLTCIPGLMEYNYAKIQVLDVPGVVQGASIGRGRGKEVLACAQSADLVMIIVDALQPDTLQVLKKEIHNVDLRLNQRKPDIKISKKARGGITVGSTVHLSHLNIDMVKAIMAEFRLNNADITIRENITVDQLIDVIEGNKKYIPGITILNKIDLIDEANLETLKKQIKPDICISADKKIGMDELKELIFTRLNLIRVYCKEVGKKADLDVPLIMFKDTTLRNICEKLHRDFAMKFRYARIWGKSVKFPGMILRRLDHKVIDGDIVELHIQ